MWSTKQMNTYYGSPCYPDILYYNSYFDIIGYNNDVIGSVFSIMIFIICHPLFIWFSKVRVRFVRVESHISCNTYMNYSHYSDSVWYKLIICILQIQARDIPDRLTKQNTHSLYEYIHFNNLFDFRTSLFSSLTKNNSRTRAYTLCRGRLNKNRPNCRNKHPDTEQL